jgi:energy-coupling factor transporter ATPase
MITVENLHYSYDGNGGPALLDISLDVKEGEYLALIGPNGCGKTTLIQHFNALLLPGKGRISVDGMATGDPRHIREIRRRVGMVFQNPDNQIVGMTVEEDTAFGPGNLGLPPREIQSRVEEALGTAGIPHLAKRAPHSLSGGEKRLVAIAGVLAMKPRYIAFDEPTSYLDPAGKERILDVIRNLHGDGMTVIHVTHNMNDIASADRVVVMNQGRVCKDGAPKAIFAEVEMMKQLGLGIPGVMEMLQRLRERGWNVKTDILTMEEACHEIAATRDRGKSAVPGEAE